MGSIVEFLPHKSQHAGKRGIVTDFVRTAVKQPRVRVQVNGHHTDIVVAVSAVKVQAPRWGRHVGDKRSKELVQVEQFEALHERFGDLRVQVRAGGFQQNKLFPPDWIGDVGDQASRIPSYELQRFQKRRLRTLDEAAHTAAGTPYDGKPHYTSEGSDKNLASPPPSEGAHDEDEEAAATKARLGAVDLNLKLRSKEHVSWGLQQRLEKGQASDEQQLLDAVNAW